MSGLILTRRGFLGLMAAAVAAGAIVPAMKLPRKPYITMDDRTADYLGTHPGGFIGSKCIQDIHDWDGQGYPVDLRNGFTGKHAGLDRYYDFDLANFRREVPANFWWNPENRERYNNVHTWLRTQRFGETVLQAEKALNFYPHGFPA